MNNTAYVLSGGGAKGAFQVGAMKVLSEKGITPEIIYGTSVGALNAYGYSKLGIIELENHWLSIKSKSDILSLNLWKLITRQATGVYNLNPLKKWISSIKTNTCLCDAVACYCDLKDGLIYYNYSSKSSIENTIKYTLASSAIPFIMEPIDYSLVDGGAREVVPFIKAIEDGYKDIYVILANPITTNLSECPKLNHEIDCALRAVDVLEYDLYLNDIDVVKQYIGKPGYNIKIIYPDVILMDTLDFEPAKIKIAIDHGIYKAKQL